MINQANMLLFFLASINANFFLFFFFLVTFFLNLLLIIFFIILFIIFFIIFFCFFYVVNFFHFYTMVAGPLLELDNLIPIIPFLVKKHKHINTYTIFSNVNHG